ncbi:DUF2306 domain-containing protein [Devosia sp. XJ19-1]|uniref:DUF2306 domain-containing protein n=1 Tax=Devosia ureilytica TaxID=2952754 RepID=A0A9Q4ARU3_9HYPH|nr:DUF2306 domain-containing protein [Devosia ureilytica]MCP8885297.1 DUF2306 domain-containing protein [Devosia ureilytica]MCP8888755.1 DUF2306 domain-containing protein [Devosia ureilytica]
MIATTLGWGRNALLWILCLGVALASWRFMVGGVEATMGFVAYHAQMRPIAFFAHVVLAPVALALVPFQLWQGLRQRRPVIHRAIGRTYGIAILISGAGGLWLAITTEAGLVAALGFGLLAMSWLGTTMWGISLAMRGDRAAHRRWMIRSIALTLAAVTLRIYIPLSMALDIPFPTAYPAIAWLCWVPNLVVAEIILRWPKARRLAIA